MSPEPSSLPLSAHGDHQIRDDPPQRSTTASLREAAAKEKASSPTKKDVSVFTKVGTVIGVGGGGLKKQKDYGEEMKKKEKGKGKEGDKKAGKPPSLLERATLAYLERREGGKPAFLRPSG